MIGLCWWVCPGNAAAQFDLERPPINYETTPGHDPATLLQSRLDRKESRLTHTPEHGYLESLLRELEIPVSSQILVFSKTSLQNAHISPRTPRAIYFNDESYVGWIPRSDVMEVMSTDPEQGQIFHILEQSEIDPPVLRRDQGNCLVCHASSRTQGVPGVLARSVVPTRSGQPDFAAGTFNTDQSSPWEKRWGGWYVSGRHGDLRHMGNVTLPGRSRQETLDLEAGANVTDLASWFPVEKYLSPHSDLVALLVLNHQGPMHNVITQANYDARSAMYSDQGMNEVLQRPRDFQSDTTQRRVVTFGDKLLKTMLFSEEFPLSSTVEGTSRFAVEFEARGPRDRRGRSLRDFDLKTRLFKYPCSYLIYSPAFDKLPVSTKTYVIRRLHAILTNVDQDPSFAHLTAADRQAILEIVTETRPGFWDVLKREHP